MEMFTFKTIYTEIATTQQSTSKEFEILEKFQKTGTILLLV